MSVVIETTKGVFTVDLYIEQKPKVCKNFLKLCKIKFYNLCLFHSVQTNFLAQTGDPTGTGTSGGESIYRRLYGDQARYFEGDLIPKLKHNCGNLSMVSAGDNMFGSQFLITLADNQESLDAGQHCVFGKIVEGLEILETLNETICDHDNRPYQDIRITHTVVLEDPFPDPPGLEIPDRSPEPSSEMKVSSRIGADEDLDDTEGLTERQMAELMAEKEAKAQATILEMVGDLPEADCAPPENVLFVCKLNPVTTDDDLEIIFSRFGKVVSCEVIRDKKTGDSLQYSFVEFDDKDACEKAYFKMDNVLIDDRRIHVDFSQSVSQYKWKGKGRLEIVDKNKPTDQKNHNEKGKINTTARSHAERPAYNDSKNLHRSANASYKKDYSKFDHRRESRSPSNRNSPTRNTSNSRRREHSPYDKKSKRRKSRSRSRDIDKDESRNHYKVHRNREASHHSRYVDGDRDKYKYKAKSDNYNDDRHRSDKKKKNRANRSRSR